MYTCISINYRKQQIFRGTKLLRFLQIFGKTPKFSLLIFWIMALLKYFCKKEEARGQKLLDPCGPLGQEVGEKLARS